MGSLFRKLTIREEPGFSQPAPLHQESELTFAKQIMEMK